MTRVIHCLASSWAGDDRILESRNEEVAQTEAPAFPHRIYYFPGDDGLPPEPKDLSDSIIHFFSCAEGSGPLCEMGDRDEWVRYDHTAVGKICIPCQNVLGRSII